MISFFLKRRARKYSKQFLNSEISRLSKVPNKPKEMLIYQRILCSEYKRRYN